MVALTVAGIIVLLIVMDIVASRLSIEFHLSKPSESGSVGSRKGSFAPLRGSTGATVSRGMFQHRGHMWAYWRQDGRVQAGTDDLLHRIVGRIDEVRPPSLGDEIKQGEKAVMIRQGERVIFLLSPVTGRVTAVNQELKNNSELIKEFPYDKGWIYEVDPSRTDEDLHHLTLSDTAEEWIRKEESRMKRFVDNRLRTAEWNVPEKNRTEINGILENLSDQTWILFKDQFIYQQEWRS